MQEPAAAEVPAAEARDDARDDADVQAVLASPVRRDLVARLRAAAGAVTAAELARALRLHVTTVRFHLEQLERAGLVISSTEPAHTRGRPAFRYRADDVDLAAAREQMLDALAQAAAGVGSREENALAAGRRWAADVALPPGDTRTAVTGVLHRLGFDPEPVGDGVRLRACPFRSAARRTPQVVCRVHLGLAQGIAARAGDDPLHVGLVPFVEPEICHLTLTTPPRSPR